MVNVIFLGPREAMPSLDDTQPWVFVEARTDGLFCGTGGSWKRTGEWVGYRSLSEDDVDLEHSIAAATDWAIRYDAPTIWVQTNPD